VRKHKPKPDKCEMCGEQGKLEIASKTHEYTKNLNEYLWLHRSCHRNFEGTTHLYLLKILNSNKEKLHRLIEDKKNA
jgi:hypothetical protein